jgi:hypothetical protein
MGNGVRLVDQAIKLRDLKVRRFGEELLVEARIK